MTPDQPPLMDVETLREQLHEHARRERHPSITANPGKLHRRYRRRP